MQIGEILKTFYQKFAMWALGKTSFYVGECTLGLACMHLMGNCFSKSVLLCMAVVMSDSWKFSKWKFWIFLHSVIAMLSLAAANPCESNGCSHLCVATLNHYRCLCPLGMKLDYDGQRCIVGECCETYSLVLVSYCEWMENQKL